MVGARDHAQVVRLLFLGDADLAERDEAPRPVAVACLDERLDVGEAQDRRQRRAWHAPVRTLALPVVQSVVLESRHGPRRRRAIQPVELAARRAARPVGCRARRPVGRSRATRSALVRRAVEDALLAVASKACLHEQIDVTALVGTRDMEANAAALAGIFQQVLDEPEPNVAGVAVVDRVELDDRPFVAQRSRARRGPGPSRRPLLLVDVQQVASAGARRAAAGTGVKTLMWLAADRQAERAHPGRCSGSRRMCDWRDSSPTAARSVRRAARTRPVRCAPDRRATITRPRRALRSARRDAAVGRCPRPARRTRRPSSPRVGGSASRRPARDGRPWR